MFFLRGEGILLADLYDLFTEKIHEGCSRLSQSIIIHGLWEKFAMATELSGKETWLRTYTHTFMTERGIIKKKSVLLYFSQAILVECLHNALFSMQKFKADNEKQVEQLKKVQIK